MLSLGAESPRLLEVERRETELLGLSAEEVTWTPNGPPIIPWASRMTAVLTAGRVSLRFRAFRSDGELLVQHAATSYTEGVEAQPVDACRSALL